MLESWPRPGGQDFLLNELWQLYQWCFDALTAKGIVEARSGGADDSAEWLIQTRSIAGAPLSAAALPS
jgi:hypothetical protein